MAGDSGGQLTQMTQMLHLDEGVVVRTMRQGWKVDRPAATLPQTTAAAIFNIVGGRVMITEIVGQVTTAIQNQANNTKLIANPTVGTSVDMCAVLNIANKEEATLLGITGVPADAMVGTNAGLTQAMSRRQVLNVGTIDLDCAASNTGAIKWFVFYIPLDDIAAVVAA